MSGWLALWKWACIIGLGTYFVLVLWVIPCGAWDCIKLFRDLSAGSDKRQEETDARTPQV